ncbi:MAG: hypothetical protein AABY00_03970 [Nanoarchaeota archaeon]
MLPIEQIRVYDPKTHRHTNETPPSLTDTEAHLLRELIYRRVFDTEVERGVTLKDYLFGEEGYFKRNPMIMQVIFVNGKFHSAQDQDQYYTTNIDVLAAQTRSIPLFFARPLTVDDLSSRTSRTSGKNCSTLPILDEVVSLVG